jgi:hypothetical protein
MNKREPKFSAHWTLLRTVKNTLEFHWKIGGLQLRPSVWRQVEVDAELETMLMRATIWQKTVAVVILLRDEKRHMSL